MYKVEKKVSLQTEHLFFCEKHTEHFRERYRQTDRNGDEVRFGFSGV